ncbi:MAG TPA: thiamine-phosphate kinase [Tepidisphaeraceae bacterium]|nr:thiamine-phosphate kinase [Tepidisphaeraceae bacterium]
MVRLAAGDDLAVLNWPGDELLLVGADQVLDGVHFDSTKHTPREIGRKAMNRNLSDCAAMACLPAAAIATVALPRGMGMEFAKELYLGLREAGEVFNCPIVGGDTASWEGKLALSVTILGHAGGIAPITRAGARANDGIYVTGALGGSILGRHMSFTPRINEARMLAKSVAITAMIDISDGLSIDLARICRQSNGGATIDASAIPIHPDATALSKKSGRTPLEHALHDGEDHELLFTCPTRPPMGTLIGRITADRSLVIQKNGKSEELLAGGWDYRL